MESLKDIAERKNDGRLEHRQYGEILFGQKTLQSPKISIKHRGLKGRENIFYIQDVKHTVLPHKIL